MSCQIKHTGTVVALKSDAVVVCTEQYAACAGCASQASCTLSSEKKDRLIVVKHPQPTLFSAGEKVNLVSTQKKIYAAVAVAYVLPLIGIMAVVVGCVTWLNNEIIAALMGLLFCGLYALLLYLLPKRFTQNLQIEITKIV
ncbi:MAG: SoxR reducing system RseC family protein [Paludibacteraceae bacterium]|nr:SoxR reducing system RseC family protein [Paludibacteraceae bacterium]